MKFKYLLKYKNVTKRGLLFKLAVFPLIFPLCLILDIAEEMDLE